MSAISRDPRWIKLDLLFNAKATAARGCPPPVQLCLLAFDHIARRRGLEIVTTTPPAVAHVVKKTSRHRGAA
jgi:hypothetical protein